MPIFKRGEVWHYRFAIQGRRFRGSTLTADKAAAQRIYAKLRLEAANQVHFPKAKEMGLLEALLKYYEEHAKHLPSAYTIDRQIEKVRAIGNVPLSELTDAKISEYVASRRGQQARNKVTGDGQPVLVNPSTINREVALLRAVVKRAQDQWGVKANPLKWRSLLLQETQERRSYLSADEQAKLLQALRPDFRPLVQFCLATGARFASAASLTWRDVDFAGGTVTFRKMKGGGTHTIPLTSAMKVLLANEKHHPIYVFSYEAQEDRPSGVKGAKRIKGHRYPFSRDGWRRPWYRALKDAGLEDFRFHDLRHTAGSRTTKTAGIAVAQKLLGHAEITTTRRYSHVLMEDVKEAMERTERHIKGSQESAKSKIANKSGPK